MFPLLVLFFCSGACGLAYQVLWVRELSFVFGVTAYAASTVLAAFMSGLALGSWLAGPLLRGVRRPLAAFGVAELLIGASAFATPYALDVVTGVYRAAYAVAPDAFALQTLARFVCAFAVLLVPTALMGLTLPLVSAAPQVGADRVPARVSALYAVNTAGAVAGALVTGFVLIGRLGVSRTFLAAASLNAVVGAGALLLDRRSGAARAAREEGPVKTAAVTSDAPRPAIRPLVWSVMAISGFASLALEVAWFRVMTQALDATTYAFTITLAVVLVGIAGGGALAARWLRRDRDWVVRLALVQIATALAVLLGLGVLGWERPLGLAPPRALQRVIVMVLVPSLLFGVSFPLLLRAGIPDHTRASLDRAVRGALIGRLYGVNVLGAIAGSMLGGFVLIPWLGTRVAVIALAGCLFAAGVAVLLRAGHGARVPRRLAAGGVAAFAGLAALVPDPYLAAMRRRAPAGAVEVFRDEGVQTAVTVYDTPSQRTLNVGGLHQANDSAEMVQLHRRIGVLPMVLHPNPSSVLVVGLGGGATAGAVSQYPAAVHVVELSESVRRAAAFFAHATYDVLRQPNVRIRVDDGRNFLALSGERFDVITADIIQPIHAGAGHLYSREYFHLVRRALKPGGVALQWIGEREKRHYDLIMRTFLDVFPDATAWLGGTLLVGSDGPLRLDAGSFARKLQHPASRRVMRDAGLESFEALRGWYAAGAREMRAFVGEGPVLTDDLPLVEYHRALPAESARLDLSRLRGAVEALD